MKTVGFWRKFFTHEDEIGHAEWNVEIAQNSIPCEWCQLESIDITNIKQRYDEKRKVVFIDAVLEV